MKRVLMGLAVRSTVQVGGSSLPVVVTHARLSGSGEGESAPPTRDDPLIIGDLDQGF